MSDRVGAVVEDGKCLTGVEQSCRDVSRRRCPRSPENCRWLVGNLIRIGLTCADTQADDLLDLLDAQLVELRALLGR